MQTTGIINDISIDFNTRNNRVEEWKDIKNYEGLYQISNWGRVKSLEKLVNASNQCGKKHLRPVKERILKARVNKWGYYEVTLSKNSKTKTFRVNRLVAITFIPNPNNYPVVNHINGIKKDNSVENLEWCTYSENLKHAFRTGLKKPTAPMKGKRGKELVHSKEVIQYDLKGNLIREWECIATAQRTLKINNISACCRGIRNKAGGYVWKFKKGK